jgi:hypothetical protein
MGVGTKAQGRQAEPPMKEVMLVSVFEAIYLLIEFGTFVVLLIKLILDSVKQNDRHQR